MPQTPTDAKPADDNVSTSAMPTALSSSSSNARSSLPGRSKTSGSSSLARRRLRRALGNAQKHYNPHICRFSPYRPPAAAVLDPFPNLRINSICMAGLSTLITVHRSGVRLYRERPLTPIVSTTAASPTSSPPWLGVATLHSPSPSNTTSTGTVARGASTASGVFQQLEVRNDFQVRESYLCVAMQPVLVDDSVLLSKWSRYFCVASGSDRVVHSVSVMSSGAHFCLHHEKHQMNKVVCMHCTQIATEPFHPAVLRPAVVSVDEVGTLVLFDVEREVPCVLETAPLWFRRSDRHVKRDDRSQQDENKEGQSAEEGRSPHPQQTVLPGQHLSPEEEEHVVDTMEKVPVRERTTYHLEHGVATRVTLGGPCLELCNHCHNAFMSLSPSRGYTPVSIYICSRAQDLPCDSTEQDGSIAAELNVTLLRVLWGPRRAFVLEEVRIVQEAAPTDVCEAGVTIATRPYQVGFPMTLLLARPALTLWQLRVCTGECIDARSLYPATGPSTAKYSRHGRLPRAASEFIIHWVPLGRHRLTVRHDDRSGLQSWFCIVAVTDDDTVLLLGCAPQTCAASPTASVAAPAPERPLVNSDSVVPLKATEEELAMFKDADLEGWLDDIHPAPAPGSLSAPLNEGRGDGNERGMAPMDNTSCCTNPYTLLMKLYSPGGACHPRGAGGAGSSVAAGVLSIMPDLLENRLILFMADEEALLTVPLPFTERVATLTDGDPVNGGQEGCAVAGGRLPAERGTHSPPSTATPSSTRNATTTATPGGVVAQDAAETAASNGFSQHLWGATSNAVRAASQGWSSSMLKWAPSSSSYFFSGSGSSHTRAAGTVAAAASPTPSSKADNESPAQCNRAAPASSMPPHAPVEGGRSPQPTVATEAYHSIGIVRPLMSAVFHFTGEDKEPPEPPAKATSRPTSVHADDDKTMEVSQAQSASPLTTPAALPPPKGLSSTKHSSHSDDTRSNSEASTVATATSLAVPICVIHGGRECSGSHSASSVNGRSRRRRRRGAQPAESERASSCSPPASPLPHTAAIDDGVAQASYVDAQMNLLVKEDVAPTLQEVSALGAAGGAEGENAGRRCEEIQFALRQLVSFDEPLERNKILYSWTDGHNDLYIRLSAEQDALTQAAATAQHLHRGGSRSASPRRHYEAFQVATAILTNTSADVADGVHSVGFLTKFHSAAAWRAETSSYGSCFNFAAYLTTLQVPQHVLDMQERDKCRLELEDLRLQQARDMTAVHPYDLMTVCQNEERKSSEAAWRLHATFPYDDERHGSVVDLSWLNRTAGSTQRTAAPEWRWATEKETRIWAEEEGKPQSVIKRVRSLMRELKDWSVGPWEYAERWPSRDDNLRGRAAMFMWSSTEAPAHRCRRRRLTRLRVNVEELRRHSDLTESHIRELEALREQLGL